jgi:V/A-type H+-transporting ATPase subunit I
LIAISGASAAIVGVLVGEAFGVEFGEMLHIGEWYQPLLHVSSLDIHVVETLMMIAILIGICHLTIGFILDIVKAKREHESVELITLKIPTLVMYLFGVLFALSFIGAGYDFEKLFTSNNPAPLISEAFSSPISSGLVATISIPVIISAVVIIIFGKAVATIMGKIKGESISMSIIMGVVEFILRVVEFLSNTISYARLGILLLVHTALMMAIKPAWYLGFPEIIYLGLPLIIVGNIGVMALEGLIVYIQDLRLHLYEWFTKFYEGSGVLFENIVPETKYVEIDWEK